MEAYKEAFIEFLLTTGALKLEDKGLKSKRISPYFVNIGDFNVGNTTSALCAAYAGAIKGHADEFDIVYGIPEKGVGLAIGTAIELSNLGVNKPWFFTRKFEKTHGDISSVVGRKPEAGQRILQLDDVFTAGTAKYQAREELMRMGDFKLPLLAIAVDRQEVDIDGTSAISSYEQRTGTNVISIVNTSEIIEYLKQKGGFDREIERMQTYLRVYGTKDAKTGLPPLGPQQIIKRARSIIPACDIETIEDFEDLVKNTHDLDAIGGYKVGFELIIGYGGPRTVEAVKKHTNKPVIYDHQKAGTDVPDFGKNFARVCKRVGFDAVILFPQAGPETERAWMYHALDHGLDVIVGGRMTHNAYTVSEGGWITDEGAMEMYRIAARAGIRNFVAPGNKIEVIKQVRDIIEGEGIKNPVLYSPGFVAQGGKLTDAAAAAGEEYHGIVGRGITQSADKRAAAVEMTSQLK